MATKRRRDYYEVLEVAENVTQDDIRSAYRKLALQWHPDKNVDNAEEAAEKFKEIQNAYTVLSNPQERAWYDAHKDSILGGGDGTEGESGTSLNLWPYFSSTAYSGYEDDNPEGFWQTYDKLFKQIDEEEEGAEDTDEYHVAAPAFGNSKTPYAEVSKFYTYWSNFVTRKDFAWCDQYNPAEAPNRLTKRWLEKHNKKAREKGRKNFNEQVKHLVEFVRARDKRVLEHMIKLKNEQAKKQEEQAKQTQEKQQKLKNMRKNVSEKNEDVIQFERELDNWLQSEEYNSIFETKGKSSQASGKEQQELYCVACKKGFKSEKQWENHEKSKKHKENVALLRESVLLDEDFEEDSDSQDDTTTTTQNQTTTTTTTTNTDTHSGEDDDSRSGSDGEVDQEDHGDTNTGPGESDEEPPKHAKLARQNNARQQPLHGGQSDDGGEGSDDGEAQQDNHKENGDGDGDDADGDEGSGSDDGLAQLQQRFQHLSKKKQKKQQKKKKNVPVYSDSESDSNADNEVDETTGNGADDDSEDDDNTNNARKTKKVSTPKTLATTKATPPITKATPAPTTTTTTTATTDTTTNTKSTKNAKTNQTKKPATPAPSAKTASASANQYSCSVCNATFTTRNAMFKHINALNHAVPLGQKEPTKPKKKGK